MYLSIANHKGLVFTCAIILLVVVDRLPRRDCCVLLAKIAAE